MKRIFVSNFRPNSSENGSSSALPALACSSGGSPADMTGLVDLKPISFEEVNQGKLNPSDERVYSGSVSNLLTVRFIMWTLMNRRLELNFPKAYLALY